LENSGKHKKAAIYYSAGIGDALLLTPLVKRLKKDGFHVTGIFTSPFDLQELYEGNDLLDEKIIILTKPKLVWFITRFSFKKFDLSFVNCFSAGKRNIIAASSTSKEVRINKKVQFKRRVLTNLQFIEPKENIHDGEQNLRLYTEETGISEADFQLSHIASDVLNISLPEKYIVLQAGAGNNSTPYKIWDPEKWQTVLEKTFERFPQLKIVLLGDKNELQIGDQIRNTSIVNLTGKTTLKEAITVIKNAVALAGSDSGLMHLAAALNKPTFTIWGASNEKLYAYSGFNPSRHTVIINEAIRCRPCSAWISPNTDRMTDPLNCPDFICLKGISPETVFEKLSVFLSQHLQNAE
jgi:ADP-heptose:LPS heptosyltransferase